MQAWRALTTPCARAQVAGDGDRLPDEAAAVAPVRELQVGQGQAALDRALRRCAPAPACLAAAFQGPPQQGSISNRVKQDNLLRLRPAARSRYGHSWGAVAVPCCGLVSQ
jgi:hypothetical protein